MKNVKILHLPQLFVFVHACFGKFLLSILCLQWAHVAPIVNSVQIHLKASGLMTINILFFQFSFQLIHCFYLRVFDSVGLIQNYWILFSKVTWTSYWYKEKKITVDITDRNSIVFVFMYGKGISGGWRNAPVIPVNGNRGRMRRARLMSLKYLRQL